MCVLESWPVQGLLVALYARAVLVLTDLVSARVQQPYMDELFHIPQSQQYCQRDHFADYDPKLTTPPGLYLVNYVYTRVELLLRNIVGATTSLENGT